MYNINLLNRNRNISTKTTEQNSSKEFRNYFHKFFCCFKYFLYHLCIMTASEVESAFSKL